MKPVHQRMAGLISGPLLLITAANTAADTASIRDAKSKQVLEATKRTPTWGHPDE